MATGGAELGKALVAVREVRMISFTGGFATGEQIARGGPENWPWTWVATPRCWY